jgi:hypothetical protein
MNMALTKKTVQIKIDKKGDVVLTAGEGFSGESCLEGTKDIEVILGGTEVDSGKTDSYYDPDSDPLKIFNS